MPTTESTEKQPSATAPVEEVIEQLKARLAPADQWIRHMAREQPLLLLAGALGIGYIAGRLIRRV